MRLGPTGIVPSCSSLNLELFLYASAAYMLHRQRVPLLLLLHETPPSIQYMAVMCIEPTVWSNCGQETNL